MAKVWTCPVCETELQFVIDRDRNKLELLPAKEISAGRIIETDNEVVEGALNDEEEDEAGENGSEGSVEEGSEADGAGEDEENSNFLI